MSNIITVGHIVRLHYGHVISVHEEQMKSGNNFVVLCDWRVKHISL